MKTPRTARGRSSRRSTLRPPQRAAAKALRRADTRDRRAVPRDGALDPLAQRCLRLEPDGLPGARRVNASPRLAVRFRRVPGDAAFVPGHVGDQLRELADGDLACRAEIDRGRAVVLLRSP